MAVGSLRGVPAKDWETTSRQNCMRKAPIVGCDVVSATREVSMLKARRARYASLAEGGMNAWSVYDGASYFLSLHQHRDSRE